MASIKSRISGLKKDKEHGAGWLTSLALEILEEASSTSEATTTKDFLAEVDEPVKGLMQARPSMVSISNYVSEFKDELDSTAPSSKSADNLKKRAAAIARKLKIFNQESSDRAARNAVKLIAQRTVVMTCSYSSDVCTALELARQKGIDFKVLATESRRGKTSYGELTLSRLGKAGISGRIIPDDFVAWHAARASLILMGADSVSLHGWMINGMPSYSMALIASHKKVPVYAICSTAKIDVRGFLAGLRTPEPGFDMVPLDLFKWFITEAGALKEADVYKMTADDLFRSPRARSH